MTVMLQLPITGGCQCGALRYEISAVPVQIYVCHCRECQKQSASAFGISLLFPHAAFRLTSGAAKSWSRPTDGGRSLKCWFCPDCGARLWHEYDDVAAPEMITVKGGSLDEPPDLGAAIHIWTARKLAGVLIPETCRQFPGEPPE